MMRSSITDADGLSSNPEEGTLVVLLITRKEVESMDTGSLLERLHALTDTKDHVMLYRESVVMQFSGYDSDKRELPEIPEVTRYMRAVAIEWPHWPWFLCRDVGAMPLLMSLLCDVEIVDRDHATGEFSTAFVGIDQVKMAIIDLLERGSALFCSYQIDGDLVEESAISAVAEVL